MALIKKLRLGTVLELFFDSVLLLVFIAQAFVAGCLAIYGYLPLPAEWSNQLIAKQVPPGLILRAEDFRLRLDGHIELVGIELRSSNIQQALLHAESAELKFTWPSLTSRPHAQSLVVSGGTLFIPSVYSPDGHQSPLLERAAFRILPQADSLYIERFAALHDTIHLRGSFEVPFHREAAEQDLNIDALIHKFYTQAAKLSQQKEHIRYFAKPTIAFAATPLDPQTQQIDFHISSGSVTHPEATAERVQLRGQIQLRGDQIEPTTAPRLTADRLELPRYEVLTEGLSAEITPDQLSALLAGDWPQLKLAAERIQLKAFELDAPILRIDPRRYPELTFRGATTSLNGAIDFSGRIDAETWSGQVRAHGSVDLVDLVPDSLSEKLPNIAFDTPPYYDLNLVFDAGFTLNRADIRAQVDQLKVDTLTFDRIDAHASYQDGLLFVKDLYLRRQQQWLDLQFSFDTASQDYRASLIGSAVPYEYNSLLPRWWGAIFEDFDFSQTEDSLGNFIIYGNTKNRSADLYFGHAQARNVSYRGVAIDSGQLILRGRGRYCELHAIDAYSGEGWARGNIAFASKRDEVKGPASIRIDMEAKLTLEDAAKLFQGKVTEIIADFETDTLPITQLEGVIFNSAYPQYAGKTYFDLSASCPAPLNFRGLPLDHLSFDLYGRSDITYLRKVTLGYAGGQATASIDILTPKDAASSLRYTFALKDADQQQALAQLPQLGELEKSLEPRAKAVDKGERAAESVAARVDIELHGTGPTEDPFQHAGYGRFEIRNDQLGTIQLLGPLSEMLQSTQFSFTSLNLNKMSGDFTYQNEDVTFEPLHIDGSLTQIKAPGTLDLKDQSLDMRVSVSLFGNVGDPESNFRKIGDLINKPIANLLQFELTGTLKDQKLRSFYDPRNFIPRF